VAEFRRHKFRERPDHVLVFFVELAHVIVDLQFIDHLDQPIDLKGTETTDWL
jgi:hypothetical protein